MRKVIGIGETVLDIIFKGGKPIEAGPGWGYLLLSNLIYKSGERGFILGAVTARP